MLMHMVEEHCQGVECSLKPARKYSLCVDNLGEACEIILSGAELPKLLQESALVGELPFRHQERSMEHSMEQLQMLTMPELVAPIGLLTGPHSKTSHRLEAKLSQDPLASAGRRTGRRRQQGRWWCIRRQRHLCPRRVGRRRSTCRARSWPNGSPAPGRAQCGTPHGRCTALWPATRGERLLFIT